ncbi:MAG TPA: hypothetical protein VMF59_11455 [Bacteroidota bacterium]|nr:hypothetical protein [Bacteroidota bacterium]
MNGNLLKWVAPSIASLLLGPGGSALAQRGLYSYPFDLSADARGFAMGESFTALPSNPSALIYNPAGLAGMSGLRASYSQRTLAANDEAMLRSFNAAVGTPIGSFAAQYNRDTYTIPTVISGASEQSAGDSYDYDIAVGYAAGLGRGFSVGVAVKYYAAGGTSSAYSTTPARLFDAGLTYTFRRFHSQETVEDSLSIGMSYQNIGSGGVTRFNGLHIPELDSRVIPQYFRGGLSYALRVAPRREGDASPLQAVVCAEYRTGPGTGLPDGAGFGMECTIDEFISVRTGGFFWIGDNDAHIRYGLAVRFPLRSLGVELLPQVAVIPWYSWYAFSVDIQSSGSLF